MASSQVPSSGSRRWATDALLIVTALATGAVAGAAAAGFLAVIRAVSALSSGFGRSASGLLTSSHGLWTGRAIILVLPALGGLIYGPLLSWLAPRAGAHGVAAVRDAVAGCRASVPLRPAVARFAAAMVCIGSGGSVGRVGPTVQVGAAAGSAFGRLTRLPAGDTPLLAAGGAAAGVAALFNAPLTGAVFGLELVLRRLSAKALGVVLLSGGAGCWVARLLAGNHAVFALPHLRPVAPGALLAFAGLGLVGGPVAALFSRCLGMARLACDRSSRFPRWLRPAAGGVVLGALLFALPPLFGTGYPVIQETIAGRYAAGFVVVLLVGKIVATSVTIGIGGTGGVFGPALCIGAVLGAAYGDLLHGVSAQGAGSTAVYVLAGMSAVLAAGTRAPVTALILPIEITGHTDLIAPVAVAVIAAVLSSWILNEKTIYG